MEWTYSDEYYHSVVKKGDDKRDAIKELIKKILELSVKSKNWNSLVLDKWVFNLGRLIGHIQSSNEAVGMDRGYRVGLTFNDYFNRLESSQNDDEYGENLLLISEEMESIIFNLINDETFKKDLLTYHNNHPFIIEITEQGERMDTVIHLV